jgi:hypothetical protein
MIAHLIQRKGRGGWVFIMPMLIAFILFVIFSVLEWDDKYIRDISLILSCFALLLLDTKPEIISEGVIQKTGNRPKGIHQFMWIEMRYWAIALGVLGFILLLKGI